MPAFTDRQMDQIDAAAARRVRDEEWRDRNRIRVLDTLAEVINAYPLIEGKTLDPQPTAQVPA